MIRCSIVVSISACHAEDPGSIPGGGVFCEMGVWRDHWNDTEKISMDRSARACRATTSAWIPIRRTRAHFWIGRHEKDGTSGEDCCLWKKREPCAKKRRRGGIEPLHVSMPRELKSRPSTSPTHPGQTVRIAQTNLRGEISKACAPTIKQSDFEQLQPQLLEASRNKCVLSWP